MMPSPKRQSLGTHSFSEPYRNTIATLNTQICLHRIDNSTQQLLNMPAITEAPKKFDFIVVGGT